MRRRFLFAIAVLASAHFYVWWRFVHATHLSTPWWWLATLLIAVGMPSLPVAAMTLRRLPRARAMPWAILVFTWFGFAVYMLCAAIVTNLATAIFDVDPRTAAIVGVLAAIATVIYGVLNVARGPVIKRTQIALSKLPADRDGYTIVQLTDVHIGPMLGGRFTTDVVTKVNALKPDLIVITGDLVDGRLSELRHHVEPLRALTARDGVYAVTGNHEYYWDAPAWLEHLRSLGIRILRNEHVTIDHTLELAGADDSSAAEDVPRAVAGRDPALPVVLLAHHPNTISRAAAAGVDLQLSGHTHGGQLLPLGWLSRLFEPQVSGLGQFGATQLYVSQGTGFWGPPMRVGTNCEIAHLTLVSR